jgi:hypothetical protein
MIQFRGTASIDMPRITQYCGAAVAEEVQQLVTITFADRIAQLPDAVSIEIDSHPAHKSVWATTRIALPEDKYISRQTLQASGKVGGPIIYQDTDMETELQDLGLAGDVRKAYEEVSADVSDMMLNPHNALETLAGWARYPLLFPIMAATRLATNRLSPEAPKEAIERALKWAEEKVRELTIS